MYVDGHKQLFCDPFLFSFKASTVCHWISQFCDIHVISLQTEMVPVYKSKFYPIVTFFAEEEGYAIVHRVTITGLKKKIISSSLFGQVALKFCLP